MSHRPDWTWADKDPFRRHRQGLSGTGYPRTGLFRGKETPAQAVHKLDQRSSPPMVRLCGQRQEAAVREGIPAPRRWGG